MYLMGNDPYRTAPVPAAGHTYIHTYIHTPYINTYIHTYKLMLSDNAVELDA